MKQGSGHREPYKHTITVNANTFTTTNDESIPSGVLDNVEGTVFNLRTPHVLGPVITQHPGIGYDDNFCVAPRDDGQESLNFNAQ